MKKLYSLIGVCLFGLGQINAQYCTPNHANGCGSGDNINDFTMPTAGINHVGSGCSGGSYGDFTTISGTMIAGDSYNFSATHSFGGQWIKVYIDFDNSDSFNEADELVFASTSGATNTNGTIIIPVSATTTTTRMRVMTKWNSLPTNSCDPGGGWGETHDYTVNIIGPPSTPPTPTQAAGVPNCATGTDLDVVGTPDPDVLWYWQTSSTGTSTATPYSGPYTVYANGIYYLRALYVPFSVWSTNSSSITVSNFPLAATPPVPVAAQNPACITDGTSLSVSAAPGGTEYYWQSTNEFGTSTAQNASSPYPVSATGTYYLAAYDIVSQCWSNTSSVMVTVGTVVPPAPLTNPDLIFACTGGSSAMLSATPQGAPVTYTLNMIDSYGDGWNGNTIDVLVDGNVVLSGATFFTGFSSSVTFVAYEGGLVTTQFNAIGSFAYECSFQILDENPTVVATGDYLSNITPYLIPMPVYSIDWYDASTGGTFVGTGSTFEAVGTSVLPNTTTAGDYEFYAASYLNGCTSSATTLQTVSLAAVLATVAPIGVTCNNGNDGSFDIPVIDCGDFPFTFSVDGGAFGPIPTNLTPGTHTVIIRDVDNDESAEYTFVVDDALAPSDLVVDAFDNDMVELSWTVNGAELEWNVEWGVPGFTPGTGTELGSAIVSSPTHIISGLDGNTDYDFYVSANCGLGTTTGSWIFIPQTTLCDPILGQAFCESFDSDSPTEACWTVLNENADLDAWDLNYTVNPFSGDQVAMLYTDFNGGNNNDWLISPGLVLTNNEILNFNYRVQSAGEPNDFRVVLSTTGTNPADFTEVLMDLASYSNITYADTAIDLSAYSGTCYIAFHVPAGGLDGWRLYIDQVCVDICIPAPGVDGTTTICRLEDSLDLNTVITAGEPNGVWSFDPNPGILSGSNADISLLPNGTFDFQYIVTTACTADTSIATVTVSPASSAGIDGTLDDYCTNWSGINLFDGLSGSIDLGGTWTNVSGQGTITGNQWNPAETTPAGSYTFNYTVSNGICPNDMSTVTVNLISCLGIDNAENAPLSVYPNPVTNILTIQNLLVDGNAKIEVLDIQGKIVNTIQLVGVYGDYELEMSNVERGMYIVRLTTENSLKEVRVVKQ